MKIEFKYYTYDFNENSHKTLDSEILNWPVIYLLIKIESKTLNVYIGETADIETRVYSHWNKKKEFNNGKIIIISTEYNNKSSILIYELALIKHFEKQNIYNISNKNESKSVNHDFHNKKEHNDKIAELISLVEDIIEEIYI